MKETDKYPSESTKYKAILEFNKLNGYKNTSDGIAKLGSGALYRRKLKEFESSRVVIDFSKRHRMNELINKRKKFNKSFGLPVLDKPAIIDADRACLQYKMMLEELNEYLEAQSRYHKDLAEVTDALFDMLEILLGMFAEHGMLDFIPMIHNVIFVSNMSKLDGDGKPIINGENGIFDDSRPIGKILKSKNYQEPKISEVLDYIKENL